MTAAERPAWLWLDGWAGRTRQAVYVLSETAKRCRIRSDEPVRLGGRRRELPVGQTALVPKRAISERVMVRDYTAWIDGARKAGISEARITEQLTEWMREDLELLKGRCPQCGSPVRRITDDRNSGAPEGERGVWVMYRCSRDAAPGIHRDENACGFAMDRFERRPEDRK